MKKVFVGSFLSVYCILNQGLAVDLDPIIENMLQNNHKLKSLIYQQEAAVHRIEQAKGAFKLQVNFNLMYGWDRFRPYYANRNIEQNLNYQYVSISQSVYNPDALAKINYSKEYKELVDLKVQQHKLYITYIFLDTLLNYKMAKQLTDLYIQNVALLKERVEILTNLYVSKRIGAEEVAKGHAELMSAIVSLNQAKSRMEIAKQTLENMLQRKIDNQIEDIKLNTDLDISILPFDFWKTKVDDNYDVRIAKKNVDIAKREIEIRKAMRYPKVSVVGSYLKSNTTSTSIAKEDTRIVASVEYPVYNGSVEAAVLEAQKLLLSANEELKEVLRNVENELIKVYGVYGEAFESLKNLEKGLEERREALKLSEEAFGAGYATKLNVVDRKLEYVGYEVRIKERIQDLYGGLLRLGFLVGDVSVMKRLFR